MVQYEAFIRQNGTETINSDNLLQQVGQLKQQHKHAIIINFIHFRLTMLCLVVDLL